MSNSRKRKFLIEFVLALGTLILINVLANLRIGGTLFYKKWDLTEEKRFTLTSGTKVLLGELDEVVDIKILLDGNFPAGFKRLQTATIEMLEDFQSESGFIEYSFDDPNQGSVNVINKRREQLKEEGILPMRLNVVESTGSSEQYIYPWAIVYHKGRSINIPLLEGAQNINPTESEEALNGSIELLEYRIADAIQKLRLYKKPIVAFTAGHGELSPIETASLEFALRKYYDTGRIILDSTVAISQDASVLVVAKPTEPFSEKDKFKLDQYVMNGGKILWLVDKVNVSLDSLIGKKYGPFEYQQDLDDLFFNYGFRIKSNLLLDIQASPIPLQVGFQNDKPQFELFPYPYHLVITSQLSQSIVKNLGPVNLLFANTIDTSVKVKTPLDKYILLQTTPNTKEQYLPLSMDFEFLRYDLDATKFNKGPQPVALLLEGTFPSMYRNRVTKSMLTSLEELNMTFQKESLPTRMIVVSDGDVAKNPINPRTRRPEPLGLNAYDKFRYSNQQFLVNAIEYLLDDTGIIEARNRQVKLRLLDRPKAEAERGFWQAINVLLPVVFLGIFAFVYTFVRRRRFTL